MALLTLLSFSFCNKVDKMVGSSLELKVIKPPQISHKQVSSLGCLTGMSLLCKKSSLFPWLGVKYDGSFGHCDTHQTMALFDVSFGFSVGIINITGYDGYLAGSTLSTTASTVNRYLRVLAEFQQTGLSSPLKDFT